MTIQQVVFLRYSVNVIAKAMFCYFAPIIAHLANISVAEEVFRSVFKTAQVLYLMKKTGHDEFLIRRRSRMNRKHDLDTDEICSEKVSDESTITPRLRAEFVGVIVTLGGIKSRIRNFGKLLTNEQEFRFRLIVRCWAWIKGQKKR